MYWLDDHRLTTEQVEERDFPESQSVSLLLASVTLSFTGTFMCTLKEEISNRYLLSIMFYVCAECASLTFVCTREREIEKSVRERERGEREERERERGERESERERGERECFGKPIFESRASSLGGRPVPAMTLIPKQTTHSQQKPHQDPNHTHPPQA